MVSRLTGGRPGRRRPGDTPPSGGRVAVADDADLIDQARTLAAEGRWWDAAVMLRASLHDAPDDAVALRELARVADELGRWGHSVAGRPPILAPIASFGGGDDELRDDPRAVARRALERAVELRPDSVAWRGALGELCATTGDHARAVDLLDEVVAATADTTTAWTLRSRHRWMFLAEDAAARRGAARVTDPLFDVAVTPVPGDVAGVVGVGRVRVTHQGVNVGGHVRADVDTVELWLDGGRLRSVNAGSPAPGGAVRPFDALLRRATVEHLARRTRLEVRTATGSPLVLQGSAVAVDLDVPHGRGDLDSRLAAGATLDKKGGLSALPHEALAWQSRALELLDEIGAWFDAHVGTPLLVLYGTLLGVHRDGDLIPGDDDVDAGYVSRASTPRAVKEEAVDLVRALVAAGYTVSVNRRGRLFRVGTTEAGDGGLHLDVHPIWFDGPTLYVPNHTSFASTVDDWLPSATATVRGHTVRTPHDPEVFLHAQYGPGWRVPDPGYVEHTAGVDPAVIATIDEALLTPGEQRSLAVEIDGARRRGEVTGRFVPIAMQPLYPLEELLE